MHLTQGCIDLAHAKETIRLDGSVRAVLPRGRSHFPGRLCC